MKNHMFMPKMLARLEYWMAEREKIRILKDAGKPAPYTTDPVLDRYRFCNVVRMDDRVSRWLFRKWYDSRLDWRTATVQATVARLINEPRTLSCFPPPSVWNGWNSESTLSAMLRQLEQGKELAVYGNAYLVVGTEFTDGKHNAIPRIVSRVAKRMNDLKEARIKYTTMQGLHEDLVDHVHGIGSFLAGQIVADVRHLCPGQFDDMHTWAPIGPGSARGMARLLGREPRRSGMTQRTFLPLLRELLHVVKQPRSVHNRLEAMDLQNCLCEFDKFCRVDEGRRPRRLYP